MQVVILLRLRLNLSVPGNGGQENREQAPDAVHGIQGRYGKRKNELQIVIIVRRERCLEALDAPNDYYTDASRSTSSPLLHHDFSRICRRYRLLTPNRDRDAGDESNE